jgi:hypothetical protein
MASKGYRFVGQGQFTGVKSADLTAEAFERLDPRAKRIVRTSGAWEEVSGDLTRNEIDALLVARGLDPKEYRTKADAQAALDAPPNPETPDTTETQEGGES